MGKMPRVTMTMSVDALELAACARWLREQGVELPSRNSLIVWAVRSGARALRADKWPTSHKQALDFLDKEWPVQTYKGGRKVRKEERKLGQPDPFGASPFLPEEEVRREEREAEVLEAAREFFEKFGREVGREKREE